MSDFEEAHNSSVPSSDAVRLYLDSTKRLDEVLPMVYWFSNKKLLELLDISESTRKRDAALLRALNLISCKHRHGCNREEAEVFWEFRQLQRWSDRDEAVNLISSVMEAIHAVKGQRTCRAS